MKVGEQLYVEVSITGLYDAFVKVRVDSVTDPQTSEELLDDFLESMIPAPDVDCAVGERYRILTERIA